MKTVRLVLILILLLLACNETAGETDPCRVLWAGCPDDYVIHHDASDMNSWLDEDGVRQVKFWNCEDHVWSSDTCSADCTPFFAS